jgi:hypothetical protein
MLFFYSYVIVYYNKLMMISQTSFLSPYSICDWFKKDIAVTLIKYGNELDTAL